MVKELKDLNSTYRNHLQDHFLLERLFIRRHIFVHLCSYNAKNRRLWDTKRGLGDNPFQAYPKILEICDAVENIEKVKETVGQ